MAKQLEIIDFSRKGNLIRFFLGEDHSKAWGDDWDDAPYNFNAGEVYERYVKDIVDVVIPFGDAVMEPYDGCLNCSYAKKDMLERRVPCVIIVKEKDFYGPRGLGIPDFYRWVADDNIKKIYFGDSPEVLSDYLWIKKEGEKNG